MTRPMLDLLLILSICEQPMLAQPSVLVAAGVTAPPYSVAASASKSSSSSSSSSSFKKNPLNLSFLPLENHLSSYGNRSIQTQKEEVAGADYLNGERLRAGRGKRHVLPHFVYDYAQLRDAGLPSGEILVYPREAVDRQIASGDNSDHHDDDSAANWANDRDYSDDVESAEEIFGKGSLATVYKQGMKFPALSLTRSMRRPPEGQRLMDKKRKWKSKNMAMWGR